MATTTIYPKNQATGAGNDTETLYAALDAAADGDTIIMSDKEVTQTTPTQWKIADVRSSITTADLPNGRPLNSNDGYEDYTVSFPGGSFQLMQDAWDSVFFHFNTYRHIVITKSLTIKGVLDGNGNPLTQIVQGTGAMFSPDAIFVTASQKEVTIQDLDFKGGWQAIEALTLTHILNCRFDTYLAPIQWYLDDRLVYPNYPDKSVVRRSSLKNSSFSNYGQLFHAPGASGMTVEGNTILGSSSAFSGNAQMYWLASPGFYSSVFPLVGSTVVQTNEASDILIKNNHWDNSGGGNPAGFYFPTYISAENGGLAEDIEITGNTWTDWSAAFSLVVEAQSHPSLSNLVRNVVVADNTFTGSTGSIADMILTGGGSRAVPGSVDNCLVTANTFVGGSGQFAAIGFERTSNSSCLKNDLTDPSATNSSATAVLLLFSSFNTIHEAGSFPPGTGGPKDHVAEIVSFQNRIVGEPAVGLAEPGIGDKVKSGLGQANTQPYAGQQPTP